MTGGWSSLISGNYGRTWAIMGLYPVMVIPDVMGAVIYGSPCRLRTRLVSNDLQGQNDQQEQHILTVDSRGVDDAGVDAVGHLNRARGLQGKNGSRGPGWPWISVIPYETTHYTVKGSRKKCATREFASQNGKSSESPTGRQAKIAFRNTSSEGLVQNVFPVSTPGKICTLLGKYGWSGHTILELRTYLAHGLQLKPSEVCEILSRQRDAEIAREFLKWVLDEGRSKLHVKCFTVVLQLLGRARKFELLESFLEDLSRRGFRTDKIFLTAAMRTYAEGQKLQEALKIFARMKEIGYKPDCVTYTVLVQMFSKAKLYQEALKLYDEMLSQGVATDTQLYNCVVSTLGKAGRMDLAYSKMQEMRERGHIPDQFTYGVLIEGYVRAGRQEYMDLYKEMQEARVPRNEVIFNMMFSGAERIGILEDAETLFADMERVGLPANLVAFSTLINMCSIKGNADAAQCWFDKMINLGLEPTVRIGNSLFEGHLRVRDFDRAKLVLDSFRRWGLVPNLATLTVCLRCLSTSENPEDLKVVREMLSCHSGSQFISALVETKKQRNSSPIIVSFLISLHHESKKSRQDFVNVLIDYLYRIGFCNQAFALWEGATANHILPTLVEQGPEGICSINLGGMTCGTAVIALTHTLPKLAKQFRMQEMTAAWVQIHTDQVSDQTPSKDPQSVHRFLKNFLRELRSPFEATTPETGGGFVCRGKQVMRWIDQPEMKALLACN